MTIQENQTTKPHKWPTREEWAFRKQHPYWDGETGCPFDNKYSHRLSDYATAEEIAALTAALKNLYRELGRALRAANSRIKPSDRQQRGEGHAAWYQRVKQMRPEDQEAFHGAWQLQQERRQINDLLTKIGDDAIPDSPRFANYVFGRAAPLVAPFAERYRAAFKKAAEQWEQECLQICVDDAAWQRELERRAEFENWRAELKNL